METRKTHIYPTLSVPFPPICYFFPLPFHFTLWHPYPSLYLSITSYTLCSFSLALLPLPFSLSTHTTISPWFPERERETGIAAASIQTSWLNVHTHTHTGCLNRVWAMWRHWKKMRAEEEEEGGGQRCLRRVVYGKDTLWDLYGRVWVGISSNHDNPASPRRASAYVKQLIHHSRLDYEVWGHCWVVSVSQNAKLGW